MVNLLFRILTVVLIISVLFASGVPAQAATESAQTDTRMEPAANSYAQTLGVLGGLLGSGIILFGAALGISRIAEEVGEFLKPDAALILEIGYAQGKTVTELIEQTAIFAEIKIEKDYQNNDRVVTAKRT